MKTTLKQIVKIVPFSKSMYKFLKGIFFKTNTVEKRFEYIYKNNSWRGVASVSGRGSDLDQTKTLIKELPSLFEDLNISSILDIPCGDFNWMKKINLNKYQYIGADIVKEIIDNNKKLYEKENVSFQHIDLIEDALPRVDLILVRDCLVHFSYNDIFKALNNICHSGSKYLLTTTFTNQQSNGNIITGEWHTLNLQLKPFYLPKPIKIVNEKCTEGKMLYTDKSLGLWKISDIANILKSKNQIFEK